MTQTAKVKSVKSKEKVLEVVDLFCGAGGTSTGVVGAVQSLGFDINLLAINHWDVAIATHTKNHPSARHECQSIDTLNPQDLVPGRRLNLLLASPECTDHSNAKGGKPRSDQKRADAWLLMRWIEKLYVENIIIENVKEFTNWGPLNAKGLPDKRYRGKYFRQFLDALSINYSLDWKILNCADFGDATTRERFFLIAKRGTGKKIVFPAPTHASRKEIEKAKRQPGLFADKSTLKPWRAAREIIDWTLPGQSIFGRKKPLSENTMRRIFAGLFKYSLKPFVMGTGGPTGQMQPRAVEEPLRTILTDHRQNLFEPYLINMKASDRRMREINEPTFTQCAGGNHQYLAEPVLVNLSHTKNNDESMCKSTDEPLKTICGKAMLGLIEPYLIQFFGERNGQQPRTKNVDDPLWTITAQGRMGLAEPYVVEYYGQSDAADVDEPLPTVTTKDRFAVAEPYIVPCAYGAKDKTKGDARAHSLEDPLGTVTGVNNWAIAEPFIVPTNHGKDIRSHSIDEPMKTITGVDAWAMVEPFLVRFKNNQDGGSINDPLKTLTAKESYGLCIPQLGAIFDIRFRMLQPHELAAAMSFPADYHFTGTRDQKVRQIGNAVPVEMAKALCRAVLMN